MEQSWHRHENGVKILISILPRTSLINAVEFCLNIELSIVVEVIRELRPEFAVEESAFEVVHAYHTAYQEKRYRYHQNIEETGDGHEQSLDTYFETFIPRNDSQGSENTKQPEYFDDFQFLAIHYDWYCWCDHNSEIDNVPSNPQIWGLAIDYKTLSNYFKECFQYEKAR